MQNQHDWVTYVQLFATLAALFLAVFMPSIQKAADRRDTYLTVIKVFRLAIEEINAHLSAMENTLRKRLSDDKKGRAIAQVVVEKVMGELEYMIKSQTTVMSSVTAVDLPHPSMAAMAAIFEREVIHLITSVISVAEKNPSIDAILTVYVHKQSVVNNTAADTLSLLKTIEGGIGPHPTLRFFRFLSKIKNLS